MNEAILYSQEYAIDFGADFNINALDLKLKRPHESRLHTRLLCFGDGGHKKCENFRIARPAFIFIRFTFLFSNATRRDETKCSGYTMPERDTRFPSAAGYYFSWRIFPQMNFMKTVFALLINHSSRPPFLFARTRCRAREAVEDERRLLVIILFQRPRKRAAILSPPSSPPPPGSSARYVIRVIYANPSRRYTPASLFFSLIIATKKGRAWKNCWQIITLASQVSRSCGGVLRFDGEGVICRRLNMGDSLNGNNK